MLTAKQIIHISRNPYGFTMKEKRAAALAAASMLEMYTKDENESGVAHDSSNPPDWAFRCPFCKLKHTSLQDCWNCCK